MDDQNRNQPGTHPDGWKDEEGDVDEHDRENNPYDYVKAPDTSAQPCGCDKGANWICQWHQIVREGAD